MMLSAGEVVVYDGELLDTVFVVIHPVFTESYLGPRAGEHATKAEQRFLDRRLHASGG